MGSWPNVINLVQSRNVWHVTFVLKCHTQFALHHSTTNHHQHQHINMSSNASITPKQISRRATDYDSQIREGLEDGSIRQVVKRLGSDLVSQKKKVLFYLLHDLLFTQIQLLSLRTKGTPEQKAAFPQPLFLFQFVRSWNRQHNDPNFVDQMLEDLERFDAAAAAAAAPPIPLRLDTPTEPAPAPAQLAPKLPQPTQPAPRPPQPTKATAPRPKQPSLPRVAGPSGPVVQRQGTTLPPQADRPAQQTRHLVAAPAGPGRDSDTIVVKPRKVEVVVPTPRSPQKFREIDEDDDEYVPPPSPPSRSPKAPTRVKHPKPARTTREVEVYLKACTRCERGDRDCEVDELGAACAGCKARKYGCDHTNKTHAKTMTVRRPVSDSGSDSEEEEMKVRKGKKRQAEPPVQKMKVKVKEERVAKVKPVKPKPRVKPQPTAKKGKGKRAAPIVTDSDEDEEDVMVVDDDSDEGEPQPKRVRLAKGERNQ